MSTPQPSNGKNAKLVMHLAAMTFVAAIALGALILGKAEKDVILAALSLEAALGGYAISKSS
jgi:hypothetical protein